MTKVIYDVLVVGGGPAGATLALYLARQGCRVALLEATTYETLRYGETLPPEMNPVLRDLDLWAAFQALSPLEAPGMISVWGNPTPVEVDFIRNVHGSGWHIERKNFDQMLVTEAKRAGAQVHLRQRVHICSRDGDLWHVGEWRSRILVDASGKNGLRLNGDVGRDTSDRLLAIALSIRSPYSSRQDLRTCVESTSAGRWYTAPLPNNLMIAMFFTDPITYRKEGISIHDQLTNASTTAGRLKGGRVESSNVLHVTSSCRRAIFGASWLAVGDSACSYDPISGRGIFNALGQARKASSAIVAQLNGDLEPTIRYANQVRMEYDEYVRYRRFYYRSEQRWPEQRFWQERHN